MWVYVYMTSVKLKLQKKYFCEFWFTLSKEYYVSDLSLITAAKNVYTNTVNQIGLIFNKFIRSLVFRLGSEKAENLSTMYLTYL
jgi:hypothetical protein